MVSRSTSFGPSAGTNDTESTIGSAYNFPGSGVIKKLRICGYNGVADKAGTGILYLYFKKIAGPFEFACKLGEGLTDVYPLPTEEIDVDIPYTVGEQLTVKFKGAESTEEVTVSITMIE